MHSSMPFPLLFGGKPARGKHVLWPALPMLQDLQGFVAPGWGRPAVVQCSSEQV